MNIGISILTAPQAHIWGNGLNQNLAFLVMTLRKCPWVDKIFMLNGGSEPHLPVGMGIVTGDTPLVHPEEVTHELDVVIEMGAQLPLPWLNHVRALGAKIVAFLVGHPYAMLIEGPAFGRNGGGLINGAPWDEVWLLPQYMHSAMPLMRTLARAPVYEVPHIWSPVYVQAQADGLHNGRAFGFDPGSRATPHPGWRVGIFEPNISVAKSGVLPLLACEHAHRTEPASISHVMSMNTVHMKEHPTFLNFAARLDISRQGKASYEPRLAFAQCMTECSLDAVVSHHWENGQNYLYYDALYGGYPLFHNSEFLARAGMGFYYPGFSACAGGDALVDAWRQAPEYWRDYQARTTAWLGKLDPEHPDNVTAFSRRLSPPAGAST